MMRNLKEDKRPFPISQQYMITIPLEGAKFLTHDKEESTISIMYALCQHIKITNESIFE